jgi:hypothetical protein
MSEKLIIGSLLLAASSAGYSAMAAYNIHTNYDSNYMFHKWNLGAVTFLCGFMAGNSMTVLVGL